jgi:hypothetical protein
MHATIRRYEGVDTARTEELTRKVSETLVPQLEKLEGFRGYYLVESGNGVVTSVGLFAGPAQSDEATNLAAAWVKEQKLESALPNAPRITSGKVIAQQDGVAVACAVANALGGRARSATPRLDHEG